jgi:drug/metabolite transporter (DMT)-like permease
MINKKAKRIFYEEFDRKIHLITLVFRSFQSTILSLINMIAVQHIDVVIVSLVNNIKPVIVWLFAKFFLKERLKKAVVFFTVLTFAAVIAIIIGQNPSTESSY